MVRKYGVKTICSEFDVLWVNPCVACCSVIVMKPVVKGLRQKFDASESPIVHIVVEEWFWNLSGWV